MNGTPRTDAFVSKPGGNSFQDYIDFSRTLERELNEANKQRDSALAACAAYTKQLRVFLSVYAACGKGALIAVERSRFTETERLLHDFNCGKELLEERDKLKSQLEIELSRETCKCCGDQYNPSLIEASLCLACIRTEQLRQRIAELESQLAMANDAADKGDKARCLAGAMDSLITELEKRIAELEKDKKRLAAFANKVWECRWEPDSEEQQYLVGLAAEVRSGNYKTLDSAMKKGQLE